MIKITQENLFEQHTMVRFNKKLFELGMASYNDPSNPTYEEEAKRVIAEFKARVNAAVHTENNELVSIIRLVEEYQDALNKAKSFCHPDNKSQLI